MRIWSHIFYTNNNNQLIELKMHLWEDVPRWLQSPLLGRSLNQMRETKKYDPSLLKKEVYTYQDITNILDYFDYQLYELRSLNSPTIANSQPIDLTQALIQAHLLKLEGSQPFAEGQNLSCIFNLKRLTSLLKRLLDTYVKLILSDCGSCFQFNKLKAQSYIFMEQLLNLCPLDIVQRYADVETFAEWVMIHEKFDQVTPYLISQMSLYSRQAFAAQLIQRFKNSPLIQIFWQSLRATNSYIQRKFTKKNKQDIDMDMGLFVDCLRNIKSIAKVQVSVECVQQTLRESHMLECAFDMIRNFVALYNSTPNQKNAHKIQLCMEAHKEMFQLKLTQVPDYTNTLFAAMTITATSQKEHKVFDSQYLLSYPVIKSKKECLKVISEEKIQRSYRFCCQLSQLQISSYLDQIENTICQDRDFQRVQYQVLQTLRKQIKTNIVRHLAILTENKKKVAPHLKLELFEKEEAENLWQMRKLLQFSLNKQDYSDTDLPLVQMRAILGNWWPCKGNLTPQKVNKLHEYLKRQSKLSKNSDSWRWMFFISLLNLDTQHKDLYAKISKIPFNSKSSKDPITRKNALLPLLIKSFIEFQRLEEEKIKSEFYQFKGIQDLFVGREYVQGWNRLLKAPQQKINELRQKFPGQLTILAELSAMHKWHCDKIKRMIDALMEDESKIFLDKKALERIREGMAEIIPAIRQTFEPSKIEQIIQTMHMLILPKQIIQITKQAATHQTQQTIQKDLKFHQDATLSVKDSELSKFIKFERLKAQNDPTNFFCYTIDLKKVIQHNIREKAQAILKAFEAAQKSKLFHQFLEIIQIVFEKKSSNLKIIFKYVPKQQAISFKRIVKHSIKVFSQFQKSLQDSFPYWHCLLSEHFFKIQKSAIMEQGDDRSFYLTVNPFQALLITSILPPTLVNDQHLRRQNPKFPYIDLAELLTNIGSNLPFLNQNEEQEYYHMISQMRSIQMQYDGSDKVHRFFDCPFFWNSYRKIVEVATFKQNYQAQINYEESRRKANEKNRQWLQTKIQQLEDQQEKCKNKKEKQRLQKQIKIYQSKFDNFEYLKQRDRDIYKKKDAQEKGIEYSPVRPQAEEVTIENLDEQISYRYGNCFNKATQIFYSIEGLIEKAAYDQDIGNFRQKQDYRQDQQDLCTFGLYRWMEKKPEIEEAITFIADKEKKKGSARANVYDMTFNSFQNHLRWMRNICVHSIKDNSDIDNSPHDKISVVARNYPKFFVFLFRYRSIIGKPFTTQSKKQIIPSIQSNYKQILLALFPLDRDNRDKIEVLKKVGKLQKYNIDPYNKFQYRLTEDTDKDRKKCRLCNMLGIAIKNHQNFWHFLNDIKRQQFNALFFEHESREGAEPCQWVSFDRTALLMFSCTKRDNLTAQELALISQSTVLDMIEREISGVENKKGSRRKKLDNKLQEQMIELIKRSDYISKFFLFELLYEFPSLIDDLRETRYLWDGRVLEK